MNKKFIVKVFAVVLMLSGLTSAGSMESLSREQKAALTYAIKNITYCDHYSVNDGANKPYDRTCVMRQVESLQKIFKAFLVNDTRIIRDISKIKGCSYYSLNDGANKPYDKPCVDNHVQTVLDDLNDL